MKKRVIHLLMIIAMGIALSACGGSKNNGPEAGTGSPTPSQETDADNGIGDGLDNGPADGDANGEEPGTGGGDSGNEGGDQNAEEPAEEGTSRYVINALVGASERPAYVEADSQMLKDMYQLDAALFKDYVVLTPMMNISTTEFAVFQVKDAKDIATVEEGIKKRAEAVQKSFEEYLPDQYENAKNYKLVAKDNYVLFVIAKDAEAVVSKFEELLK